jgi:hypothetical protein
LKLAPIPLNHLEASRHLWYPFIEGIAKRQRCFVEQRLADLYSGNVAIILVWDENFECPVALVGYSLTIEGLKRVAKLVWLAGAGRKDWSHLYDDLEHYLKDIGCAGVVALARPGWTKDLKRRGYRLTHVEYKKDFA